MGGIKMIEIICKIFMIIGLMASQTVMITVDNIDDVPQYYLDNWQELIVNTEIRECNLSECEYEFVEIDENTILLNDNGKCCFGIGMTQNEKSYQIVNQTFSYQKTEYNWKWKKITCEDLDRCPPRDYDKEARENINRLVESGLVTEEGANEIREKFGFEIIGDGEVGYEYINYTKDYSLDECNKAEWWETGVPMDEYDEYIKCVEENSEPLEIFRWN